MRKLAIIAVLVVVVIAVGAWVVGGHPPLRFLLRYGFSWGCAPTGQTKTIEGVEFVEIGPGCFRMGSTAAAEGGDWLGKWCARLGLPWGDQPGLSSEMPVHWVELPHGFWIARTEVTNEQYRAFNPKYKWGMYPLRDREPVVDVSWEDAKKYCAWLSEQSGQAIRLPSESEWECACRAGSKRDFCLGDDEKRLGEYAWYDENSDNRAHEVGTRRPNAWELHDFHGNAREWCEDTLHPDYELAPEDGSPWTDGGWGMNGHVWRVLRGGAWRACMEGSSRRGVVDRRR